MLYVVLFIKMWNKLIDFSDDCIGSDEISCVGSCIWTNNECSQLKDINICNSQIQTPNFILLASNPNLDFLYEIASSEYTSDYSNTEPYLNIVYEEYEQITKESNKFIINDAVNYIGSSFFVSDTLLNNYNSIFIANFLNN